MAKKYYDSYILEVVSPLNNNECVTFTLCSKNDTISFIMDNIWEFHSFGIKHKNFTFYQIYESKGELNSDKIGVFDIIKDSTGISAVFDYMDYWNDEDKLVSFKNHTIFEAIKQNVSQKFNIKWEEK